MNNISIVIPVYNEAKGLDRVLGKLGLLLENNKHLEIIVVDGGSTDSTFEILNEYFAQAPRVKILSSELGRAVQMNAGASVSRFDNLLFLHIDTELPADYASEVDRGLVTEFGWGRFDVVLDDKAFVFKVISFFINWRSRLTSIATGDQAIFITRCLFERVGGFPNQLLMEDVEISKRLKYIRKPHCSYSKVRTSSRKWREGGVLKTIFLMWSLRYAYFKGASPEDLYKRYYSNH